MDIDNLPRRDVAIHFLRNGSAVAFDEFAQTLFAFGRPAAFVWCSLLDRDVSETAADLAERAGVSVTEASVVVDQCLARWARVGLLGDAPPHKAKVTSDQSFEGPSAPREIFSAPAVRLGLVVAGAPYDLRIESDRLAQPLESLLRDFPTCDPAAIGDNLEGRVDVVAAGEAGAAVYIDGWLADNCDGVTQVAPTVKFCLTSDRVDGADAEIALHGAAVTWTDAADYGVLLAGPAGSGKSTLAAGLVAAGYGHVSDDTVMFDPTTRRFRGFGFGLGIKAGAWRALTSPFPEIEDTPTHERSDGLSVRYLGRRRPVDTAVTIDTIVFPTFKAGSPLQLETVDTATVLSRLLAESGSGTGVLTSSTFNRMATWLDGVRAEAMTYGDLNEGVVAVESLRRPREVAA